MGVIVFDDLQEGVLDGSTANRFQMGVESQVVSLLVFDGDRRVRERVDDDVENFLIFDLPQSTVEQVIETAEAVIIDTPAELRVINDDATEVVVIHGGGLPGPPGSDGVDGSDGLGVLVLDPGEEVPPGTPAGTVIYVRQAQPIVPVMLLDAGASVPNGTPVGTIVFQKAD